MTYDEAKTTPPEETDPGDYMVVCDRGICSNQIPANRPNPLGGEPLCDEHTAEMLTWIGFDGNKKRSKIVRLDALNRLEKMVKDEVEKITREVRDASSR